MMLAAFYVKLPIVGCESTSSAKLPMSHLYAPFPISGLAPSIASAASRDTRAITCRLNCAVGVNANPLALCLGCPLWPKNAKSLYYCVHGARPTIAVKRERMSKGS
jgi:hypothetical protein